MKALILAAGRGRRLGACAAATPKCLLRIHDDASDTTLLDLQLRALREHGIQDVVIVVGHRADRILSHVEAYRDLAFRWVVNPDHATTNTIDSLHRCRDEIDDDVLLVHGDLVFDPALLGPLLAHAGSAALVSRHRSEGSKDFVARIDRGRVREIGVGTRIPGLHHDVAPLYRLAAPDMTRWMAAMGELVAAGEVGRYAEDALNPLLDDLRIDPVWYDDALCLEVDTVNDLRRARQQYAAWRRSAGIASDARRRFAGIASDAWQGSRPGEP